MTAWRGRPDARYVVVGAGASGSLLVRAMAEAGVPGPVLLVDDESVPIDERVWASWRPTSEPADPAVSASWRRLVIATDQGEREIGLNRHRYVAVRGRDLRNATDDVLGRVSGERLIATAVAVRDDGECAVVSTTAGELRAEQVFDSVGLLPPEPSNSEAWMTFEGCEVEADLPSFDPDRLRLMDFRVPQQGGVAFLYTLPWSTTRALVEYTRIHAAKEPASANGYLSGHLDLALGAGRYRVLRREAATLPLTVHVHRPRTARCLAVGATAGLVRASTGYGYEFMRRDSATLAEQLAAGRPPTGLRRLSRHRVMDAVFLDLARHDPATLAAALELLFARNSPDLVLRFLSETTTPAEEVRVASSMPMSPFMRATLRSVITRSMGHLRRP